MFALLMFMSWMLRTDHAADDAALAVMLMLLLVMLTMIVA